MSGDFRLAVEFPDGSWLEGARSHDDVESALERLREVAPEWRKVWGSELEIGVVEGDS